MALLTDLNSSLKQLIGKTITRLETSNDQISFHTADFEKWAISRMDPENNTGTYLASHGQYSDLINESIVSISAVFQLGETSDNPTEPHKIRILLTTEKGIVGFDWRTDPLLTIVQQLDLTDYTPRDMIFFTEFDGHAFLVNDSFPFIYVSYQNQSELIVTKKSMEIESDEFIIEAIKRSFKKEKTKSRFLAENVRMTMEFQKADPRDVFDAIFIKFDSALEQSIQHKQLRKRLSKLNPPF